MTLTPVPSWTATPTGGTGELAVPATVVDAAAAVAAHARVVGLLATETEVTTEVTGSGGPITVVDLDRPSWREVISTVRAGSAAQARWPAGPVACRQPGLTIIYAPAELRIRYQTPLR